MKQNDFTLVVTDHQLTAYTIGKAIGATEEHTGYYLGNGFAVVWTGGTLIEAEFDPEQSFVLSSNMDARLAYAHNFKFAMRNYDELLGYKKSEFDQRQLDTIRALWQKAAVVVNAMTPDFDGDLDFLNLYWYLAIPKRVRRAWMPRLTNKVIRHAVFHGPQDNKQYEKWLCDNIFTHLTEAMASVEDTESEVAVEETPVQPLHNIGSLMVAGAVELDLEPDKVVKTAMTLYMKKLISYPLVLQNTIPTGVWRMMRRNVAVLAHNSKHGSKVWKGKPNRMHNFRHSENVYDGFGIVTTGLHPTDLTRDEERLYNLIVENVLTALKPIKRLKRKNPNR